ncbi:MAG: dinitrogenase iron-molybdenum cofactor biosynthesis protein [Deltaproteobacteria bacterium RBG_13_49_15]|nr:MAG: dinitrogenase iron-molybdenum cofactor biosynthesis protein [Deltaproteobacteria bacterium RBG_13_49_15]
MKVAVTSSGKNLDSAVDPRFGRAAYFLIVDTDSLEFEVVDNSDNINAFRGAGIQAAATIGNKGAEVLLTGFCGPNAFKTLAAANIKVANEISGTVREAVAAFKEGKVSFSNSPNVDGHW